MPSRHSRGTLWVRAERVVTTPGTGSREGSLARQLRLQPEAPIAPFAVPGVGHDELEDLDVFYRIIIGGEFPFFDSPALPKLAAIGDDAKNDRAVIAGGEPSLAGEAAPFSTEVPHVS